MVSPLGTHRYCYHAWALRKFRPDRGIWMTGEEAAGLQKEHSLAECMASWDSGGLDICLILLRHLLSFGYALDTTDSLAGTSNAEDCLLYAASRDIGWDKHVDWKIKRAIFNSIYSKQQDSLVSSVSFRKL